MYDDKGEEIDVAPRAKQIIKMPLPFGKTLGHNEKN